MKLLKLFPIFFAMGWVESSLYDPYTPVYTPAFGPPYYPSPPPPPVYNPKPAHKPTYTPKVTYAPKPDYTPDYKPALSHKATNDHKPASYKPDNTPAPSYKPGVTYKPAPTLPYTPVLHYKPEGNYEKDSKPYSFDYGVKDDYTGAHFGHKEKSDGQEVKGSYSVALPDGRIQTVKYKADHEHGFQAEVSYEGDPVYPVYDPKSPAGPSRSSSQFQGPRYPIDHEGSFYGSYQGSYEPYPTPVYSEGVYKPLYDFDPVYPIF
ncbi:adhesive plaque matrix protein-like [Portunus trituberculatus]|uniref:adhesive plaque matrix protein-like n=1 Tax=Portunus trituberculatus TaxID=210409 RepID=UPI001E1CECBA|nr:adhesive plaque matrix protein-like [Portunus trituberculatus]